MRRSSSSSPARAPGPASSAFSAYQGPLEAGRRPQNQDLSQPRTAVHRQPSQTHGAEAAAAGLGSGGAPGQGTHVQGLQLPGDVLKHVGSMFSHAQDLGLQEVVLQRAAERMRRLFAHRQQS